MQLKKMTLAAALLVMLTACNETAKEANPDDDSVVAIPDKDYTLPAQQDTGNKPIPLEPNSYASQINAADTLFEDGSIPSDWGNAGFDDPAGFKMFVAQFKDWVKADNIDSISAHINFPVGPAKTPAIFKEKYNSIFDGKLKNVVAKQRLDRIFRNADGAMIGSGQLWFTVNKGGYMISGINKTN